MLFHVRMDVHLPHDLEPAHRADLINRERSHCEDLQRVGTWRHLWRVVGEYSTISIFDVESNDDLHDLLSGLPLFPHMDVEVTPLATHPSALHRRPGNRPLDLRRDRPLDTPGSGARDEGPESAGDPTL